MDKAVVQECLAFCQALSADNKLFSFALKIGSDTFNFELKELVKGSCSKKKKSPSQLRRELRRREERKQAATKTEEDIAQVSENPVMDKKPKCDSCGKTFNSEEELNAHNDSDHKAPLSPEKERSNASVSELQVSPLWVQQRDEDKLSEQEGASSPLPCVASPPPSLPSPPSDLRYFCAARGRSVKVEKLLCTLISCDTCCGNDFNCKQWRKRFLDPDLRPTQFD